MSFRDQLGRSGPPLRYAMRIAPWFVETRSIKLEYTFMIVRLYFTDKLSPSIKLCLTYYTSAKSTTCVYVKYYTERRVNKPSPRSYQGAQATSKNMAPSISFGITTQFQTLECLTNQSASRDSVISLQNMYDEDMISAPTTVPFVIFPKIRANLYPKFHRS